MKTSYVNTVIHNGTTPAQVDAHTRIWFNSDGPDGQPVLVETTRANLDRAMDDAAQHLGTHLDHGTWTFIGAIAYCGVQA